MDRELAIQQILQRLTLPPDMTIRAWRPTDFPEIQALATAEGWKTLQERPDDGFHAWENSWPALVALHQGAVIGFLRALTDEAVTLYVADVLVAPTWRGRRIGTVLLDICHDLYPTVRFDLLSTEHADLFYQNYGFRPFRGFRKSYV